MPCAGFRAEWSMRASNLRKGGRKGARAREDGREAGVLAGEREVAQVGERAHDERGVEHGQAQGLVALEEAVADLEAGGRDRAADALGGGPAEQPALGGLLGELLEQR